MKPGSRKKREATAQDIITFYSKLVNQVHDSYTTGVEFIFVQE